MLRPHSSLSGAPASPFEVATSCGRYCSALRGRALKRRPRGSDGRGSGSGGDVTTASLSRVACIPRRGNSPERRARVRQSRINQRRDATTGFAEPHHLQGARSRSNLHAEDAAPPFTVAPDLIFQSLPLWQLLINDDVDSRAAHPYGLTEPLKIAALRHGRSRL